MNAATQKWESYTDKAGRRHWRWPAEVQTTAAHVVDTEDPDDATYPRWQQELAREGLGD
jgi:predicted alpha/beta hydrolase family esterase